jgi:hypothetical protein
MRQKIDMNGWERRSAQAWTEIGDYYAPGEAGEADLRNRIGEVPAPVRICAAAL